MLKKDTQKNSIQGKDFDYNVFVKENHKYVSPAVSKQFPLIASSPVKNTRNLLTDAFKDAFKGVINCGFNVGRFDSHALTVLNAFRNLQDYNQTNGTNFTLLSGADVLKRPVAINDFVPRLMHQKYLGGYDFSDEPKWDKLDEYFEMYEELKKIDPNHLAFINLIADPQKAYIGPDADYDKYLQYIQDKFHPSVWSFDCYPIYYTMPYGRSLECIAVDINTLSIPSAHTVDIIAIPLPNILREHLTEASLKDLYSKLEENFLDKHVNLEGYYHYLSSFSRMSALTQRPFYCYFQTMSYLYLHYYTKNGYYYNNSSKFHPKPTIPFLRFVIFSALGYGAQGLLSWTYCMRSLGTGEIKSDSSILLAAIADLNGEYENYNPEAWKATQQVLQEIKKYSHVFLGAKLIKCSHFAKVNVPGTPQSLPIGPLRAVSIFNEYPDDTDDESLMRRGVMVSHLANADKNYIVMVNHNPFDVQNVVMLFQNGWKITYLTPVNYTDDYLSAEPTEIITNHTLSRRNIPAGSYIIFQFEPNK